MSTSPTTWQEVKDRIFKIEFIHGTIKVPLGITLVICTYFWHQYMLYAAGYLIGIFAVVTGIYELCYNPVKKEAALVAKRVKYLLHIAPNLAPTPVTVPPPATTTMAVTPPVQSTPTAPNPPVS